MTAKGSSAKLSPLADPQTRRRVEILLAPVRLDDPYPAISIEEYTPAIQSLMSTGRSS